MTPAQLAYRAAHYVPWHERIGDGGPIGWITAAAYVAAALLCLRAGLRASGAAGPDRPLWLAAGAALIALGINKQLDLQVALIEFGRSTALEHGWYGARRTVQRVVFAIAILAGGIAGLWLLRMVRRRSTEMRAAFAGMALIGAYVALRAAKFHHVLWSTPGRPAAPGWLALLELSGLALVSTAAWRYHRSRGRPS